MSAPAIYPHGSDCLGHARLPHPGPLPRGNPISSSLWELAFPPLAFCLGAAVFAIHLAEVSPGHEEVSCDGAGGLCSAEGFGAAQVHPSPFSAGV